MSEVTRREEDECVAHVKARLEAYGFGPPPEFDRDEFRRRGRLALGVIVVMILSVMLAQIGNGQPMRAVIVRGIFMAIELPILFALVAKVYDYTLRRRLAPLPSLVLSAGTSIGTAVGFVSLTWCCAHVYDPLAIAFPAGIHHSFFAALSAGVALGMVHLGVFAVAFIYPFAAQDARVRALEAEKLRTVAELARLRGHLEPHFLLNTLNAIAGLVTEDPREARRLLAALGDLLRDALRDGDEMHPLEQEEAFLRRYAEILESRHKGSLSFKWDIDADVRGIPVPRMLLQPLVENAVKHGALRRRGGGVVTVRASRAPDAPTVVECTVEDDGPGFSEGPIRQGALGLNVVKRRLELKFQHAAFRIESSTEGTRAILAFEIPPKSEPVAARATTQRATA
jgi:signal transduction histidine kinase